MTNLFYPKCNEYLAYDPETGIFTWLVNKSSNAKVNTIAGSLSIQGYIRISLNDKRYYAHRLAWFYVYGIWPKEQVDHINSNRTDNRICNLREATKSQNMINTKLRKNNKSGIKGISWRKDLKKQHARLTIDKKIICIGNFFNLDDAKLAIENARIKYHGKYANHG